MVPLLRKPQFIIDENGQKSAAVVPIEDYQRLLEVWKDQIDIAEADEAKRTATSFITADEARQRLESNP